MNKFFKFYIIIIVFGFCKASFAQSDNYSKNQKNKFWDAELFYEKGDYLPAIELLKEVYDKDKDYSEINYLLGDSYYQLNKLDSAITFLEKGISANSDAYYQLAFIYLNQENFKQSKINLELFQKNRINKTSKFSKNELKQLKSNIEFAQKELANPEIVNVINLGKNINTDEDEYVPLITATEELLIFTSRREEDNTQMDPYGEPFENIYSSTLETNKTFSKAELLNGKVNTKGHDACVGLSPDGNTLYIF